MVTVDGELVYPNHISGPWNWASLFQRIESLMVVDELTQHIPPPQQMSRLLTEFPEIVLLFISGEEFQQYIPPP